jgi:hypothetical protein
MLKSVTASLIAAALLAALPLSAHANKKTKPAAAAATVPAASAEQLTAAGEVLAGQSKCEFSQSVSITQSAKHAGYFDLQFNKLTYLMKPVVSPTGAVRLEDTKGGALWVQIANKSMLLNPKSGQRLVDDCVHPVQAKMRTAQN